MEDENSTIWGVAMAGRGDPFTKLTPLRQTIIQSLHKAKTISEIALIERLSEETVCKEIKLLVEAHLVGRDGELYRPTFLVVDSPETILCMEHAAQLGYELAACLKEHWTSIESAFRRLQPGRRANVLADHALFLVGARLLDIVLLEVLARDGSLMSVAPWRPGLDGVNDYYFLWMIERPKSFRALYYGQNVTELPWEDWSLLTFGAYTVNGVPNEQRKSLEIKVRETASQQVAPRELAEQVKIPFFDHRDVVCWEQTAFAYAAKLLGVYKQREADLLMLYRSLKSSVYVHDGFGEFFCWYHHLVYTAAIDTLIDHGMIQMPTGYFAAALWQGRPVGESYLPE